MNQQSVQIAVSRDIALVKISGKGNFVNSLPIKQWLLVRVKEGYHCLIIDLGGCSSMDSTFMGAITGLSLRMKRLNRMPITLTNISAHNKRLLETLGLDKFLDLKDKYDMDSTLHWDLLPVESLDKLSTTKHMIEAHEEIMGAGGKTEEKFKVVRDLLKNDLKRQIEKKKSEENG